MNRIKKHFIDCTKEMTSAHNYVLYCEIGETKLKEYISLGQVMESNNLDKLFEDSVSNLTKLAEEFQLDLSNSSWFGSLEIKENNWVYGKEREIR